LFKFLPSGLIGLTIAGFLAAMASAVSATLNSASTLVSMDIIQKFNPNISSKKLVLSGQLATLFFMGIAVLWAPQISKAESFMDYMQGVLALISPPVVAVFLAGLFSHRITSNGAFAGLLTGFFIGIGFVILQVLNIEWAAQIPFLLKAPLIFFACLSVTYLVSLTGTAKNKEALKGLVWTSNLYREETLEMKGLKWYNNYRILSVLLLLATFVVVYIFR